MDLTAFQARFPSIDRIQDMNSFFLNSKEHFSTNILKRFYQPKESNALYIYQIQEGNKTHVGVVAGVDIQAYEAGKLLKHENTLPRKEAKQAALMKERGNALKPVLLTYPPQPQIAKWLQKYMQSFPPHWQCTLPDEAENHQIWKIEQVEKIRQLQELFQQNVPKAYIADGHHRSKAAYQLFEKNKNLSNSTFNILLCAFFDFEQLDIQSFNKVVQLEQKEALPIFLEQLQSIATLRPIKSVKPPNARHTLLLRTYKNWYQFQWKESLLQQKYSHKERIDATILNVDVFQQLLGIEDIREDKRIRNIAGNLGISGIEQIVKNKDQIGFLLYPTRLEDLIALADQKQVMPPKSTWFQPRIKNGLFVKSFKLA